MLNEEQFRRIQLIVFIDYACFFVEYSLNLPSKIFNS